jgi:hypothetical protein
MTLLEKGLDFVTEATPEQMAALRQMMIDRTASA